MRRAADMVEGLAVGASFACLLHCLALPLLIAAMPVLSASLPVPASFHLIALCLAVPATGFALLAGYRRHRFATPLLLGTVGLTGLALGALTWGETPLETPVTVAGSLAIAAAHWLNWRWRRAHATV